MTVALVIAMIAVVLTIDYFLHRSPDTAPAVARPEIQPSVPRLYPSVVGGFRMMDNLRYHPGHTWVVSESPELVRVGIDDFAARLAGKIDKVTLPARGQWIRQGQKAMSIERDGATVHILSPMEGSVTDINEAVLANPALALSDPYGEGWLFTVNAPDAKTNFRNLMGGSLARRWMEDTIERLRAFSASPAFATAQDGGLAVDDLTQHLDGHEWENVAREFFLS